MYDTGLDGLTVDAARLMGLGAAAAADEGETGAAAAVAAAEDGLRGESGVPVPAASEVERRGDNRLAFRAGVGTNEIDIAGDATCEVWLWGEVGGLDGACVRGGSGDAPNRTPFAVGESGSGVRGENLPFAAGVEVATARGEDGPFAVGNMSAGTGTGVLPSTLPEFFAASALIECAPVEGGGSGALGSDTSDRIITGSTAKLAATRTICGGLGVRDELTR